MLYNIYLLLISILGNVVTQLPNFPFESTNQFISAHIVPQIKTGQFRIFVRDIAKLRFGIGPPSTNGKAPPTSELALQDREVVDIQGLLPYLVCDRKDNYIVHLVLSREDQSFERSYEPSSSMLPPKVKQEPQVKKESKRPPFKKVKQEPKIKQEMEIKQETIVKVGCTTFL